jgi:tRNA 2-thiouridine synthesizing protein A
VNIGAYRVAGLTPEPLAEARLDVLGLKCPLPVLKTQAALARLAPGDVLEVVADDPLASIDIPHAVTTGGHAMLQSSSAGGVLRFTIRKTAG